MCWRIVETTDNQHEGELLDSIDEGNIITFEDGDVISIDQVMMSKDEQTALIITPNYQIKLVKE